jgi:hypothetical protein
VLTTGGAAPWAICHDCESGGGGSLRRGWSVVLGWFLKPILLLLVVYVVLRLLGP